MLSFAEGAKSLAKAPDNLREATVPAVDTGMRPISELFPLIWADVDLTTRAECPHGVIRVCQGRTVNAQRREIFRQHVCYPVEIVIARINPSFSKKMIAGFA